MFYYAYLRFLSSYKIDLNITMFTFPAWQVIATILNICFVSCKQHWTNERVVKHNEAKYEVSVLQNAHYEDRKCSS